MLRRNERDLIIWYTLGWGGKLGLMLRYDQLATDIEKTGP